MAANVIQVFTLLADPAELASCRQVRELRSPASKFEPVSFRGLSSALACEQVLLSFLALAPLYYPTITISLGCFFSRRTGVLPSRPEGYEAFTLQGAVTI